MIRIPSELTEYRQWVVWRCVVRNGRATKIPVSPWNGQVAACNRPETWSTFSQARFAQRRFRAEGVGFVLTVCDPFCGIDLDQCRRRDGLIEEPARQLIREIDSYTEISASGRGVHILLKGELPTAGRRTAGMEIYASGRYFTMTGKHLSGTPSVIEQRQQQLDALLRLHFAPDTRTTNAIPRQPNIASDRDLTEKALKGPSGPRFQKLWCGDSSDYDGDHSRADAALCRMLAFWTGGDLERVDRLFRMSGLMREKWDRRTGQETYGARTIRISSRC